MLSSMRSRAPIALALLLLGLGLAGCDSDTHQFPPDCRKVLIPADSADLTVFRGSGTDLTDMVLDGQITGVPRTSQCTWGEPGHVTATVSVAMTLRRGPAMQGRAFDAPYFVAVTRGDQILNKQVFVAPLRFRENDDSLRIATDSVTLDLPVGAHASASDYQILVGFQLTPAELAFNRRRGPR